MHTALALEKLRSDGEDTPSPPSRHKPFPREKGLSTHAFPALTTALALCFSFPTLRSTERPGSNPHAGQVFVVDANKESGCTWELGVWAILAIVYYKDGGPMTVRRLAQSDDIKLVGSFSAEDVTSSIQKARHAIAAGKSDAIFDF